MLHIEGLLGGYSSFDFNVLINFISGLSKKKKGITILCIDPFQEKYCWKHTHTLGASREALTPKTKILGTTCPLGVRFFILKKTLKVLKIA